MKNQTALAITNITILAKKINNQNYKMGIFKKALCNLIYVGKGEKLLKKSCKNLNNITLENMTY